MGVHAEFGEKRWLALAYPNINACYSVIRSRISLAPIPETHQFGVENGWPFPY